MGRRSQSDEAKLSAGKQIDPRYSDEARAKDRMATVLAFPVLKKIPKSEFPLGKKGTETFKYWCERILDAGLLTKITVGEVETLALIDDKIDRQLSDNKSPSAQDLDLRRKSLAKLETLNVSTGYYANETQKSEFAENGFPNRLRTRAQHKAKRTRSKVKRSRKT